jgi:hypothetical protein
MDPKRDVNATLVDLLDRILDKGLMLNADVIISLSGIPLLGLNLKAAIASVETMLRYGMWEDWGKAQRAIATEERRRNGIMDEETETCPSCGRRAPVRELLAEGCTVCGWVSPGLKKKEILVQH